MSHSPAIAFFGTSDYAVMVLEALQQGNFLPKLIITTPDRPAGKGMKVTAPPVKIWAEKNTIKVLQPEKLKDPSFIQELTSGAFDLFIVVAYGKIIPQEIIDLSPHGALNVHASLLPKLRGASPIETAILEDLKHTGITIMLIDSEMDHGPIIAKQEVVVQAWPPKARDLGKALVEAGGKLLVETIPTWLSGNIQPQPQDHTQATYTKKIVKEDGLIDFKADPYLNFRKIQAYADWPRTYFFAEKDSKKVRMVITEAEYKDNRLHILKVIPEGKNEMNFAAVRQLYQVPEGIDELYK
ncbi:methionyl-tRNA formyltransferase [Candidatus Parcubacteria bacterium]|nr:methionyl-tRNA formyltransferase [Candidatus Parcubacteria bacterium]